MRGAPAFGIVDQVGRKGRKSHMRKSTPAQWGLRVLVYILGLFFLAMGVAFSVNSNLGVSPVNSLPYVISQVSGAAMSACVIVVFCSYIALQVLILRREFKPINLLQIAFSTIFGYFVDFAKWIVGDFALPTYAGQLAMLAISILFIAVGVILYIDVELVPMPMEGLSLAMAKKLNIPFHNMKIIVDCVVVAASIAVSFLFLHGLVGIREGTVITAIVTGKVMALLKKPISPAVQRLCFSGPARRDEQGRETEEAEGL